MQFARHDPTLYGALLRGAQFGVEVKDVVLSHFLGSIQIVSPFVVKISLYLDICRVFQRIFGSQAADRICGQENY
jgi:hypothetical protein